MPTIDLPANDWAPRDYQRKLWAALERGGKRAIAVWHRRAGKDDIGLHWAAVACHERVGTYWHLLPEAAQARKAIWDAINPHTGKRRIDEAFPMALRETTREHEMLIKFKIGSTWQVVGSDNYDSLVGSPPVGVVFSEWALANPAAWAYIRPILAENGGWSLFIYTPRGRNHGSTFYENHKGDPEWFVERLRADQTSVFSGQQLERERTEYIREFGPTDGENRFRQEYLCDFNAAVIGAYYAREMAAADDEKRVTKVPREAGFEVITAWDLGIGDSTAVWFAQIVGREVRIIDYLENSGVGIDWYAQQLKAKLYTYGETILPHDAQPKQLTSGKSVRDTLSDFGFKVRVLSQSKIMDGINAARLLLPKCVFDGEKCRRGIEALRQYRQDWDEERRVFHDRPRHDWASHGADAFRYLAQGLTIRTDVHKPRVRHFAGAQGWMS